MKMSQEVTLFCVLTLVALSYESEYEKLSSIDDLKRVYSEKSVPMHSLTLLHWFANNTDTDNNNEVRLSFDPNADFGSHSYENSEGLLAPVPGGYQYYTVGNLNPPNGNMHPKARDFPPYVRDAPVIDYADMRNRDRIIVQEQTDGSHGIGQMYLTQHFRGPDIQGSRYDPDHTFEISTNLLRQLRLFSFSNENPRSLQELRDRFNQNIDDTQLNDIVNIWGRDQAPLGLLYLIVNSQRANLVGVCGTERPSVRDLAVDLTGDWHDCELQQMQIDVTTGDNGTVKIEWKNVPQNQLNDGASLVLLTKQVDQEASCVFRQIKSSKGSYDTSVPLKVGLQFRLDETQGHFTLMNVGTDSVPIHGYDAKLQFGVRQGHACFIVYIKTGFNHWKSDFYYSWVGLYKSPEDSAHDYLTWQWQWVIYFDQALDSDDYETYFYCTSTKVASGFHARFLTDGYNEIARTSPWS